MKMFSIILLFFSISYATIINIPADYSTIQQGIDASSNEDTVLVQPGTYYENINFSGKNITVGSLLILTSDPDFVAQTVIDGNQNGSTVTITSGEDESALLRGFTITNGSGNYILYSIGGGIYIDHAHPRLEDLNVIGNHSTSAGFQAGQGGGIAILADSSMTLKNVVVADNQAHLAPGILAATSLGEIRMENVTVTGNMSVPVWDIDSPYGSIFVDEVNLTNSIFYNNEQIEIQCRGSLNVSFSNILDGLDGIELYNNGTVSWLEGNIDADPLFDDPLDWSYHLLPDSPCIDSGDPTFLLDPDCSIADMGALPFDHCESVVIGDLQGDGAIDILDIVSMVSCIMEYNDDFMGCLCHDMNDDCILNILDIIRLVQIVLDE